MEQPITSSDNFISMVEYLTYKSYEFNRLNNPQIEPSKWSLIYPNIEQLEQKFKEQKCLRKQ